MRDSRVIDSRLDALIWMLGAGAFVSVLGIGWVDGDALVHANRFEWGSWWLNPNHLLMEPAGAALYDLVRWIGVGATTPDRLQFVNAWVGALSLGMFRGLLAPILTDSRLQRNVATGFLAGGWAFLSLWLSGKPHFLQLPLLILAAWAVVRYVSSPTSRNAVAAGFLFGVASLFFASNSLLGAATGLGLFLWCFSKYGRDRALGHAALFLGTALILGLAGALIGWSISGTDRQFLSWILSYSGEVNVLEDQFYGAPEFSLGQLLTPLARSLYGTVRAAVDLEPLVEWLRGRPISIVVVLVSSGLSLGAVVLFGYRLLRGLVDRSRPAVASVVLAVSWLLATVAFGTFFNTAENQFYFHLSVPLAMIVASTRLPSMTISRAWYAGAALLVIWNIGYVANTQVAYPRQERLDELEAGVRGADLVIYPGHDESNTLLMLLSDTLYRQGVSLISLSRSYSPEKGLGILTDSICNTLRDDGVVRAVSVFGAHPREQPWGQLRRRGYRQERVVQALDVFDVRPAVDTGGALGIRNLAFVQEPEKLDGCGRASMSPQ